MTGIPTFPVRFAQAVSMRFQRGVFAVLGAFSIALLVLTISSSPVRAESSVVFVLDRSGSMEQNDPNNFSAVAANVALDFLELIDPSLKVGVIEFSDEADSLTSGGLEQAAIARRALEAMRLRPAKGGTNMMAALRSAFNHLSGRGGEKRIVLLADGEPTGSFDEAEIINRAQAENVQVIALGIALGGAGKTLLSELGEQTNGGARFVSSASEMVPEVRALFSDRQQQLWNINPVTDEELQNGRETISFDVPEGMDRLRISVAFENNAKFREEDLNITLTGPSSLGVGSVHDITLSGNQGPRAAVWTDLLTAPQKGQYTLSVRAGSPSSANRGNVRIYADSYSDIRIEATLLPSPDVGYPTDSQVRIDVVVKDGSGNIIQTPTLSGQVSSLTGSGGSSVTFAPNGASGSFVTPKEPGDYELQLRADLGPGLSQPLKTPIRFRIFGEGPVELVATNDLVDFQGMKLGLDQDELNENIVVSFQSEVPQIASQTRRKSVSANLQWAEPLIEPNGQSMAQWLSFETDSGRRIRSDGKTPFSIPGTGLDLTLKVQLPNPDHADFKLLKAGRYQGLIRIDSQEAIAPLEIAIVVEFVKPDIDVALLSQSLSFFWDPSTPRQIPALSVSANYTTLSEFLLDVPEKLTVDGVHFADLTLAVDGKELTPTNNRYGPFTLSRDPVGVDLVVTPVQTDGKLTLPRDLGQVPLSVISNFTIEPRIRNISVSGMGSVPAALPLTGWKFSLPVLGPFSFYLSDLAAYLLFIVFCIVMRKRLVALFVKIPAQMKWKKGVRFKVALPNALSLSTKGTPRTLNLPKRWTKVKGTGDLAEVSIDDEDRLVLNHVQSELVLSNGEPLKSNTRLEMGETFEIGPQKRGFKRLKPAWMLHYIRGDQESGEAHFKIKRTPYGPSYSSWLFVSTVVLAIFFALIQTVQSSLAAKTFYGIGANPFTDAISRIFN
ncbi:vWA domain-containing protein [Hoeflea sp. AS60]|uniref:vWA domain-containing protein n=1 Tax=Hoeflea sp. AS60 TaxID=3135780 RepID=UPI0031796EB0